jgi:glycine oxidase
MKSCIIVGGGLTGLLLARELASAGIQVTVVERGCLARESSWAGGGILSPLYPWRYPGPVTALAGWSQRVYARLAEDLRKESGVDPEYIQSGLLIQDNTEHEQALAWAERHEVELYEVGAAEALQIEPRLGESRGGLWLPQIGQVRNPRMMQALVRTCERRGVTLRENDEVLGLLAGDNTVQGVKTRSATLSVDAVVVAGGAWSRQILAEFAGELQVEPVKGQMLLYRCDPGFLHRIVLSAGHYVIPRRDGHVLAGSTLEDAGFDKTPTEEARRQLQADAVRLIPQLAGFPVVNHWAGLRPGSPEGIPYIGAHSQLSNLFVSAGHFRNGVAMAPASARLLADLMLGREPVLAPEPYAWPA